MKKLYSDSDELFIILTTSDLNANGVSRHSFNPNFINELNYTLFSINLGDVQKSHLLTFKTDDGGYHIMKSRSLNNGMLLRRLSELELKYDNLIKLKNRL